VEDVRVAAVQMCAPVAQVNGNLKKTREFVRRARDQRVDIVCFPETNISGYWSHRDLYDLAEPIPGRISEEVVEMATETGVTILAGMVEMGKNGVVYNTQIVATPQGLAGKYRKLHVNESEIPYFSYGYDLPVFHHPKVRFGIEICYDSHFPELSTALVLKGCELLFFPHASGEGEGFEEGERETREEKRARWLRYMPARAYDNAVFVVVCNQVGDNGGGTTFPGVSMVIDPKGRVIAEAQADEEDMIVADLRARDLVRVRKDESWHFFLRYRRPELYEMVVERSP
jgi:predicted amidohydrolase